MTGLNEKLHSTTDAAVWAQEFMDVLDGLPDEKVDLGLMISWFANAIEVGRDAGRRTGKGKVAIVIDELPGSEQADRIMMDVVPNVLEHFLIRNRGYGDAAHDLGVKGQFADINRKFIKVRRFMWDGIKPEDGEESLVTVLKEMVGHILLTLDMLSYDDPSAQGVAADHE